MMSEKRKLKPVPPGTNIRRPLKAGPAKPLQGALCRGCQWATRCRWDGFCWKAEKLAIARERAG